MHRFSANRLWTLIMVFGLLLGALTYTTELAWADDGTTQDQGEGDGLPNGTGDPDTPIGSGKMPTPSPGISPLPQRYTEYGRLTFVGDGWSGRQHMIWRLQYLLRSLSTTWVRF